MVRIREAFGSRTLMMATTLALGTLSLADFALARADQTMPEAAGADAASGVRLATAIVLLDRTADGDGSLVRYTITIRPSGGTARSARLDVTAESPARWRSYGRACRPADQAGATLTCGLGDIAEPASLQMTLRVPASASRGVGLVAVAGADNALSQETAVIAPAPGMPDSEMPSETPQSAPETSQGAPDASQAVPDQPAPSHQPPQHLSQKRTPPYWHAPQRSLRPPLQHARPMQHVQPLHAMQPVQPMQQVQPMRPPSGAGGVSQSIPQSPDSIPALPPPGTAAGAMAGPPAGSMALNSATGPLLPQLPASGPQPTVANQSSAATPAQDGSSELSMATSAAIPGSRASWLKVLAITVVAEVALLWVATVLGLWRRRSAATAMLRAGMSVGRRSVGDARFGATGIGDKERRGRFGTALRWLSFWR